ncbi:TIR domain-containing protein [Patescibacteria group bacterium]|nr:TIR domain-containing protein [Patescibacteria group bacterium]
MQNKKRCFISFDYDHDKVLKDFLIGQSKKEDSPFEISDWSIKEPSSDWKDKARTRIKKSEIVIVLCGHNTNTATGVSIELEIAQEEDKNYFLLAGYSSGGNKKPSSAKTTDKLYSWTWDNLKRLIHGNR